MKAEKQRPEVEPIAHSVPTAAAKLGVANSTMWQWIADGVVDVVRIKGRTLITDEAIRDLLQRNTTRGRAA